MQKEIVMKQENKDIRFDESIEKLKDLLEVVRVENRNITEEDIIDIFPELKYSDDENMYIAISQGLSDMVEDYGWSDFGGISIDTIRDWLMKKLDAKNIPCEIGTQIEQNFNCGIEHIEHGKYYYCIKDYYSGGCKRASKGDVVQALRGMTMMSLGVKANEYFLPVNLIMENKLAWSREDEEMFDSILADIRFIQKAHNQEVNQAVYEKEIEWFKSLKDRV